MRSHSGDLEQQTSRVGSMETIPDGLEPNGTASSSQQQTSLLGLTPDTMAAILLLLPLHDVCAAACTCTRLR